MKDKIKILGFKKWLCLFLFFAMTGPTTAQIQKIIPVKNGILSYKTFGDGFPVLIINGGPGFDSGGFEGMAKTISGFGYRTILFDQRGTGESRLGSVGPATITMDLMVDDIEAIRKDLKTEKWVILGHSFGGMLANYYAAKHPERVQGMIQSSSGGLDLSLLGLTQNEINKNLAQVEIDRLTYLRQQRQAHPQDALMDREYRNILAKAYVKNLEYVPVVAERLSHVNSRINSLVWNDLNQINYDTKVQLAKFAAPVLILHGEEDVVPKELAQLAADIYPQSDMIFLEGSRHYGWLDNPVKYFGSIKKFLKLVCGAS